MKKIIFCLVVVFFGLSVNAQTLTKAEAKRQILSINPEALFTEDGATDVDPGGVLADRRRVTNEVGWLAPCPGGGSGGIGGVYQCTTPYFLGFPVGPETCRDINVVNTCE